MAAGIVTVNIKDGDGTTRTGRFWSSDGTTSGLLYPLHSIFDGSSGIVDWTTGTAGTPAGGVTTVQGQSGMTPVLTTLSAPNRLPSGATAVRGIISSAMTGTTSTAVSGMGAPAASNYNYITELSVSNSHATVGTDVELQDGNGGTSFWIVPAAAVYGGAVLHFDPPLKQPTSATALYAKNATTGASVRLTVNGYTGL